MARGKDGGRPKGGKKNRKYGRNKKFCEKYRNENRREKNKTLRIEREARRLAKCNSK